MRKRLMATLLLICLIVPMTTQAQEIPFLWGNRWNVSARAAGMAGAYTGVAKGYGAFYYNPAGLGLADKTTFYGSFSRVSLNNTTSYLGNEYIESTAVSGLNSIGVAVPLPTSRGSLVFGIGYHKVQSFDRSLYGEAFISTVGDSVTASYTEFETGGFGVTVFGGAIEVSPDFFIGTSLNFWTGVNDYTSQFTEADTPHDLWTFSEYYNTININTKFTGVSFTLSGLMNLMNNLRVGVAVISPVTLIGKEDWTYSEKTDWDDGVRTNDSTNSGFYEYKLRAPWKLRFGGSLQAGPLLVSADVEFNEYNKIKYTTDPPIGETMAETNLEISRSLQNTVDYSVGCELKVPATKLYLRGGYAVRKSPYKDSTILSDRTIFTFGAGYEVNLKLIFHVAYSGTSWKRPVDEIIEKEAIEANNIMAGFSYIL